MDSSMQMEENTVTEAGRRPVVAQTSEELQAELGVMTWDIWDSGEEVHDWTMQLAHALNFVVRTAPAAPHGAEDNRPKCLDAPDYS